MNKEEILRRWKEAIFNINVCIPCIKVFLEVSEQLTEETGYRICGIMDKQEKIIIKLEPVEEMIAWKAQQ